MTSPRHKWQKGWSRELPTRLHHISGLIVNLDDDLGWRVDNATLAQFEDFEQARGVTRDQLMQRLWRLCREAAEWHQNNP